MSETEKKEFEKKKLRIGDSEVDLTIDNRQSIELAKENQALKDKLEGQNKGDLSDAKLKVYNKFHDVRALDCETKEQLSDFITMKVNLASESLKRISSGSAPLNEAQMGQKTEDLYTKDFGRDVSTKEEAYKNMIEAVIDVMHNAPTQIERDKAESYYKALLGQSLRGIKKHPEQSGQFYDPNSAENMISTHKDESGYTVADNPDETDLGKIKKKWRAERNRKLGIKDSEQ